MSASSLSNGNTPLHAAIYFRMNSGLSVIRALLAGGARLSVRNRAGLTPLESAKAVGDKEAEAAINEAMKQRHDPRTVRLMEAVRNNDEHTVNKILQSLPKKLIDQTDEEGFTPLLWAAREGFVNITTALLKRDADPNKEDGWMGANAGHKAAFWGRDEIMPLLIAHHLQINAQGIYNGYTPLHDAVSQTHVKVAQILIEAGARTDIAGYDGKTALDLMRASKNSEIRDLAKK